MTITESALAQRIRRKLKTTSYLLRKARGERQQVDCGRYCVIDAELNALLWHHVNLEAYARELGVLRENESMAELKLMLRIAGTWSRSRFVSAVDINQSLLPGQWRMSDQSRGKCPGTEGTL